MGEQQRRNGSRGAAAARPNGADTRQELLDAGLGLLGERGYAASRLADIAAAAGVTTGAFYRHFVSKLDFFHVLFEAYGTSLTTALSTADDLEAAVAAWLMVARRYRGVVRAAAELMRPGTAEATLYRELRKSCTYLLERHLRALQAGGRPEALVIVDTVDQYAFMEACGWIGERPVEQVAETLNRLVTRGLYCA